MARLDSWLSPQVMHALGWALIHSLWQCLACAAMAAVLMVLSRRPSVRYLVGVGALAAMLAAPVATFLVLATTPAHSVLAAGTPLAAPVVRQAPAAPIIFRPAASAPPHGKGDMKGALEGFSVVPVLEKAPASNILPWLVAAWLCGVAFFSLRFAGGFLLLEHLRRNRSTTPGAGLLALCRDVQRQLGLDRGIEYLECAWLQTPAVIGWLRPAVLIPLAALTGLSEAQLRAVIAHELAHIRRFDLLVNLFQIVVETLLFYHPAMWWLNKRIRAERELCCDEIAIAASGNRLEYAKALTLMAEWDVAPRLAMAANRGPLTERIFHILGRKSANAGQRILGLTGSVLFLLAALAAANALFDIAAPPIAQAKESVKAALSASQTAVAHMAQQVFHASEPAATNSSQEQRTASTVPEADQRETENEQDQKLVPPAADLSKLPAIDALTTPTVLAFNSSPSTAQKDQSAAPVQTAARAGAAIPKTQSAMMCLLGQRMDGCETVLVGGTFNDFVPPLTPSRVRGLILDCSLGPQRCFNKGPDFGFLKKIEYLGANKAGADVYVATFVHSQCTYVFAQPTPGGQIPAVWNLCSPLRIGSRRPLVELQPPVLPARTIFSAEASTLSSESSVAPAASGPKTEAGIRCLLGLGTDGCSSGFGNSSARQDIMHCTGNWGGVEEGQTNSCPWGPLKSIEYRGTNIAGDDVYSVSFLHSNRTYVLPQPGPDGKIATRCMFNGSRFGLCLGGHVAASATAKVTSPANPPRILYTRPAEGQASATSGTANTSGPKTEAGIRCLLGLGPDGCWRSFESRDARQEITSCADKNWDRYEFQHGGICVSGPLQSIEYLGANATGEDVYSARFMHRNTTYVLRPPGPDGKIARFCISPSAYEDRSCFGDRNTGPSAVTVASPASPVRILYARPAEWTGSSAANASGPKTEAGLRCLLGLEPEGCEARFENPSKMRRAIRYCAGEDWSERKIDHNNPECIWGALLSIEYLGTDAAGDDVYSTKFMHTDDTHILPLPGPNGKIARDCWVHGTLTNAMRGMCSDGQEFLTSSVKVTSPPDQARILYRRSAEAPAQISAATSVTASDQAVVPNTPSGAGDPNAVVCRAPQPIAGSDQLGAQVCLHNSEWWKVAMNGKDVSPDGKTLIDRPTVDNPKGDGDPDAITCRTPSVISRGEWVKRHSPPVCRLNSFWADVIKKHQMVDLNGKIVSRPMGNAFFGGLPFGGPAGSNNGSGLAPSGQMAPGTSSIPTNGLN